MILIFFVLKMIFWSCPVNSVRRAVQNAMLKPEIHRQKVDFREGVVFGRRETLFIAPRGPPRDPRDPSDHAYCIEVSGTWKGGARVRWGQARTGLRVG